MFFNLMKFAPYFVIMAVLCEQGIAHERICGPMLTEVMDAVCTNGYPNMIKKSNDLYDYANTEIESELLPYPYGNLPFLAKIHGGSESLLAKSRRRRQGIIDECCRNSCNQKVLQSYCL